MVTDPMLRCSMPCTLNAMPRTLLASQWRCAMYTPQNAADAAPTTSSSRVADTSLPSGSTSGMRGTRKP